MPFYTFECPKCKRQKEELQSIVNKLGGTMEELFTADHSGRTSNKIVIEYNRKIILPIQVQ